MNKERIEIGDVVNVYTEPLCLDAVTVRYMPQGPGDCWVFVAQNGAVHYVQTYYVITLSNPSISVTPDVPF